MISCTLAVCAEHVLMDRLTNLISVVNVLERVTPESFPVVVPRFACLFIHTREQVDSQHLDGVVTFKLGDQELMRGPVQVDFASGLISRSVLRLQALVIPAPGVLRVSLELGGAVTAEWKISCEGRPTQTALPLQQLPESQ
jgi:hypothetical protein